jgi:hypothetical protein
MDGASSSDGWPNIVQIKVMRQWQKVQTVDGAWSRPYFWRGVKRFIQKPFTKNQPEEVQMAKLNPGDSAPAFEAPDQNQSPVRLGDYEGRKLFVFFYPKANTSG